MCVFVSGLSLFFGNIVFPFIFLLNIMMHHRHTALLRVREKKCLVKETEGSV